MTPDQVRDQEGGLAPEEYGFLLNTLVEHSRNAALPFQIGLEAQIKDFGLLGHGLMMCSSFEEMSRVGERYSPLNGYCFSSNPRVEKSRWALVIQATPEKTFPGAQALLEEFVALSARMLSDVLHEADTGHIEAVHFAGVAPRYHRELAAVLDCPLRFDQPRTEILLKALGPDNLPEDSNRDIAQYLWQQCEAQLQQYKAQNAESFDATVRRFLRQRLPHALPSHRQLAGYLNMSPRTLNRRLKQCDTSFRDLVTEEKMRMARELLEQTDASVEAIALQLGYAQPSSFFRAYRKFHGTTPKA